MNAMDMLKCCLNWKVLAGLGAIGLAIWIVAPGTLAAALPLLAVLVCPLSMVLMMVMMGRQGSSQGSPAAAASGSGRYTCSMHPDVTAWRPGPCRICGMPLELVPDSPQTGAALTREERLAELRSRLEALDGEEAALAREIHELEAAEHAPGRTDAVVQAEQVARKADRRRG